MVEPAFEESIGFTARAMKNFGLLDLALVNPQTTLGKNGRMRGGHAQDVLDAVTIYTSLPEALDGLDLSIGTTAQRTPSATNLLRKPMTPRELAEILSPQTGTVGIVLGREGTGLNNTELGLCDAMVTIPSSEEYPTLNVSHAAAILFYELQSASFSPERGELATVEVKDTILRYMSQSLTNIGLEEYKIGLTVRAARNVLGRSAIRKREASLLAGALRGITNALSTTSSQAVHIPEIRAVKLPLEQ
jgi:TrmH family RNA methyltransferase